MRKLQNRPNKPDSEWDEDPNDYHSTYRDRFTKRRLDRALKTANVQALIELEDEDY